MPTVYLETSFLSSLAAPPRDGRDPIAAAHQQITLEELLGDADDQ